MERACKEEISEFQKRLEKMNERYNKEIADIKEECRVRLETNSNEHRRHVIALEDECRKQIEKMELDCENKIKALNEYIADLKKNQHSNFNSLSKVIYNCTTIEEIFKIRNLIKTQRIDELLQRHLPTLQKIMSGLVYGVIPICNPQRTIISNKQRKLINDINDVAPSAAKQKIQSNRREFSKLWSIIDDSLQLVCDTYNRYGSLDDDDNDDGAGPSGDYSETSDDSD